MFSVSCACSAACIRRSSSRRERSSSASTGAAARELLSVRHCFLCSSSWDSCRTHADCSFSYSAQSCIRWAMFCCCAASFSRLSLRSVRACSSCCSCRRIALRCSVNPPSKSCRAVSRSVARSSLVYASETSRSCASTIFLLSSRSVPLRESRSHSFVYVVTVCSRVLSKACLISCTARSLICSFSRSLFITCS